MGQHVYGSVWARIDEGLCGVLKRASIACSQPDHSMMLHTFSTLGCPELDLDGVIALAARHGLHALELRTLNSTTDLPAWFAMNYGTPAGLAAHLKQRHVKVCAMGVRPWASA
jgi:sugar phosphate isomerase/epimerase